MAHPSDRGAACVPRRARARAYSIDYIVLNLIIPTFHISIYCISILISYS
eukprot:SAG31_NODE_20760_length_566_cov_0.631692_2_plen_49_part_01